MNLEWKNLIYGEKIQIRLYSSNGIYYPNIYKQWYVRGINEKINTIDKLIDLLRDLTNGFEVMTVGISAGGYIAALAAAKLNTKKCYDFSGQVSLWKDIDVSPFLKIKREEEMEIKGK